jgi:hypothetical protein
MSKPRYDWWSYAKSMIRKYPALKAELAELHEVSTTAPLSGMPRGTDVKRQTETIAIRELPKNKQREYEAVRRAIVYTQHRPGAYQRMQLIYLLFWKNPQMLTFVGVARQLYISVSTAKRYSADFILLVGKNYGFFD